MTRERTQTATDAGRRVAVGLSVVAAMLLVASACAGVVAAEEATVSTENGDLVVKTNATNESAITVRLGQKTVERQVPNGTTGGPATYRIAPERFPGGDLSNVSVTVKRTSSGTRLARESLDLRHARLGQSRGFTASNGTAELRLELDRSVGLSDGDELTVVVGTTKTTATVRNASGTTVLDVPRAGYGPSLTSADATVRSPEGETPLRGERTVNLLAAARDATAVERTDAGIHIDSPAIRNGTTYAVVVRSSASEGVFRRPVEASAPGRLTIEAASLAAVGGLNATVSTTDGAVVAAGTPTAQTVGATLTANGTAFTVDSERFAAADFSYLWIRTDDGVRRLTDVDATDGTVNLSGTGYALEEGGYYQLLLAFDGRPTLPVTIGEGGSYGSLTAAQADGGGDAGGDGSASGGLLPSFPSSDIVFVVFVVFVVALGVLAVVWFLTRDTKGRPAGEPTTPPTELTVNVRDKKRGVPYDAPVRLVAEPRRSSETVQSSEPARRKTERVEGGEATVSLDGGVDDWEVTVDADKQRGPRHVSTAYQTENLTFEIPPYEVDVVVHDETTDEPLSDVAIDVGEDGRTDRLRTGPDGSARLELSRQADGARLAVDRDRYESKEKAVRRERFAESHGEAVTFRLTPERGSVAATVSVDGVPRPNVAVELDARDEWTRPRLEDARATTDANGRVSFDGVPVGQYRVTASADAPWFDCSPSDVTVSAGETADVTLDVAFVWSLDDGQRDRANAIRDGVDDLTSSRTTDVAVPRYYGSVVDSLLDTVERLPDCGRQFARTGASPDHVTDAVLDRADDLVGVVDDAMTTKHNVDLFTACADMPDARVEWTDSFEVVYLFELVGQQRVEQRRELRARLQSVDERIDGERGAVSSIHPVSDTYDKVKRLVGRAKDDDDVTHAVTVFAACGLLDAAEGLFDEPALRERLERTMF
jgi:hypothetical protein